VGSALPGWGRHAEPSLLILISLSDGPKHGYAIMSDAEAVGGRRVGAGTLYAALARLESQGLIAPLPDDGSRRRPYRLTAEGAASLTSQLENLRHLADTGLDRLEGAPG